MWEKKNKQHKLRPIEVKMLREPEPAKSLRVKSPDKIDTPIRKIKNLLRKKIMNWKSNLIHKQNRRTRLKNLILFRNVQVVEIAIEFN